MHHIFPQNASVVHGKEDQIKPTVKLKTFSILSPSEHASMFHIKFLGVSQYQHKSSHSTYFHQTTVSHENMGLSWISSLIRFRTGIPPESTDPKPLAASCIELPSTFCNSRHHRPTARMCHVIILCHYMGSSQILPSEIQACGIIKAFFCRACWLRVGNGTHTAALRPNLREDTKGFAMPSSCYVCKTCHLKKKNRLKLVLTLVGSWKNL